MGMVRSSFLPLMGVLSVLGCQSGWNRPKELGFRTSQGSGCRGAGAAPGLLDRDAWRAWPHLPSGKM